MTADNTSVRVLSLVAALLLGVPVLVYADAPAADPSILDQINVYRALTDVAPAQVHPALAQSAANHVAYYDLNSGDSSMAGMGLHQEAPALPGFTGASMGDRARAAGYGRAGAVTENAGFGNLARAVDWYMSSVNHRLPLIHPCALDIGYAVSDASGFSIVDVGLRCDMLGGPLPSIFPGNGATGVPTAWDGAEAPDPAPGAPRPLGYPVTVAFGLRQKVDWKVLELRTAAGEPVEVVTARIEWMRAAAIIPLRPLAGEQTYGVHVEALVDGQPLTRDTLFQTR